MNSRDELLNTLERVMGYIKSSELDASDKERITKETIEHFEHYVSPGWLKYRKSVSTNAATVEWQGQGSICYGLNGEEFIDCLGGFGIFSCGHRNPEIIDVVKAQLDHQALHSQELLDPLRGYLAKTMAAITPGDLEKCFFTNGGAEAVEMALKLARIATGGTWYISALNGFHGKSMGALSVSGKDTYRKPYLPLIQQVRHVEYGNAKAIEDEIISLTKTGEKVAAVILEPIQGEAGVIIPPEGYLKTVRKICDHYGVALIIDEIQTGMGRTGTMWRSEAEGIVPDIMTYGKAFGGGVMPITGIICRPHMWTEELVNNPWLLGSPTFGGNPLSCSAALATITFMLKHDIPGQFAAKGDYFIGKLRELMAKHQDTLTDVRGTGLMLSLEFRDDEEGYTFAKSLFAQGVMVAGTLVNARCIRLQPAATITYEQLDLVLERIEVALQHVEKERAA